MYQEEWGQRATPMDACREYALNAGRERTESAWILTDFDAWMPNPFYQGPPVPHPEDWYDDDVGGEQPPPRPVVEKQAPPVDEDIPF